MSHEVASLVIDLWKETLGELEDILAVDIKTLTADKVQGFPLQHFLYSTYV